MIETRGDDFRVSCLFVCKPRSIRTPKLIPAIRAGMGDRSRAVVKPVDLFLYFGRKTDSVQFVTTPQPAHGFTDLADFAEPRMGIAILDIDTSARLNSLRRVVA